MKRFLRSKLVLRLAAIVMIGAVVAVALSGNIVRSHAAPPATVLSENFETGAPGWTMTGLWHIQILPQILSVLNPAINPNLVTLPDSGQLPAAYSGTHAAWFGDASTGTFCGSDFNTITQTPKDGCTSTQVQSGELTSPAFSLAGATSAEVQFQAWWEIESVNADTFDLMTVEYSVDGGASWQQAGKLNPVNNPAGQHDQDYTANGIEKPAQWSQDIVDLSGAAGQSNVQIRFRFDTVDTLYNGFRGWLVDNVVVSTPFISPNPSIANLNPTCVSSSASLPVTVTGSNFVSGSTVLLDGNNVGGAVLSAQAIEFTANNLAVGNHTVQVVSPNGATSNTVTLTSALSCSTQSTYVALGDSYSSGEGNPPWEPGHNSHICDRSYLAWPMKFYLREIVNKQTTFTNLACSGAKASDSLFVSYKGQTPQISAMAAIKPNLVTITIGGNDIGFVPTIEKCAASFLHDRTLCTHALQGAIAQINSNFGAAAVGYYDAIKNAAPKNARIFVVGYPRLFPTSQNSVSNCGWLSSENRTLMNELDAQLDNAIASAAKKANLDYVSTWDSLNGHELCTKNSWVNPLYSFPIIGNNPTYSSQGHPNANGQSAIAAVVANYFLNH